MLLAAECLPLRPFQERHTREQASKHVREGSERISNLVCNLRRRGDLEWRATDRDRSIEWKTTEEAASAAAKNS